MMRVLLYHIVETCVDLWTVLLIVPVERFILTQSLHVAAVLFPRLRHHLSASMP